MFRGCQPVAERRLADGSVSRDGAFRLSRQAVESRNLDALVRAFSRWERTDEGVHPTFFNGLLRRAAEVVIPAIEA